MAAIQRDITERTEVEDALRKEKAFTESALNSLQDVFYVFDLNGRLLRWNKSLSAITGYSDEEISLKEPTDFFLGEDIQRISNAIEMTMKNGTTRVEAELITKNGEHIDYEFTGTLLKDCDGKPQGISGVGRDISERKRMQLEYKTILHSAMDGFYVTDSQGRILDVNDSYCSLIGYSREELLNMNLRDIEAIETEEMIAERIHRILKVGWDRFETRHKCKDGRIVEIEASVNYNKAGGGKFFVFMHDITKRILVQQGYKESEARLSEAQRIAHIGNWEWNVKTNELYWSAENYKIFGLSPTISPSFEGFLNTIHHDDLEFVKKSIDEALHGKQYDIDIRIIKPDGTDCYLHATGIVNFDEEGNPIRMFGTVQDITKRKLAEYELSKFKLGIERSNEAIFITDIDGTIIYINPAFENLYGFNREETLGKTPRIIKSGLLPSESYKPFWDTLLSKKVVSGELINKTKDGRLLNIEGSANPIMNDKGNIIGFLAIQRDITEHKRIVEIVKESEERFRSITQSATDAIITADSKGDIIFWNNGAQKLFGYRDEEVRGKNLTFLMPEKYRDAHQEGMERLLATGVPHVIGKTVELSGLRKDGSEVVIELSLSSWKTGDKVFYSGILRDITERKYAEKVRFENERLAAADQAKSEFLANMSHELRTPLNSSIGFSELLKQGSDGELSEKQKHFVDNILASNQFLLTLINDILDLSKIEAGKIELVSDKMSVPVTIKETLSLIKEKAMKHNVLLKTKFDPELEFMEADKQRFKQILFNLLNNAVKFSKEEGGTVTITTKKEGDMAKVSVSDTGIGIKEENIGRLFQKFEQLESGISQKYGGTGLGLAITKQLVELHGGKIWAESQFGEGTTFTFLLPILAKISTIKIGNGEKNI
ncbi:MAG: PAS domain S-box protein [Candidatus Methanoperedens sp.]|nr:PAS domain S-box protein [Candidatus Methanoperedens sp.]